MAILRVVDIETTGLAPPAEIIEIGRVDLIQSLGGWEFGEPMSSLYRPINGITPETMAIHHITDSMVANSEVCTPLNLNLGLMHGLQPDVFVAHNCGFERSFIGDDIVGNRPWICTLKCALRLWPDAVGHSNQVLRYSLGLQLDENLAMPPHRAAPDAYVTANILQRMLQTTTVDQLIAWTSQPKFISRMPFGKHKNTPWAEMPIDYLQWMTRQADMDADVVWWARHELEQRAHGN